MERALGVSTRGDFGGRAYWSRGLRNVGFAGTLAAVVTVLVVSAQLTGAATTPVTLAAPYAHASSYDLNKNLLTATGCGEKASAGVLPKWSASTGLARFALKTTSTTCTGTGANGTFAGVAKAAPMLRAIVALPLTSADTSVAASWSIQLAGIEALAESGGCPTPVLNSTGDGFVHCSAGAGWSISIQAELVDKTTRFAIHDRPTALTERSNSSSVDSNVTCSNSVCTTANSSSGGAGGSWSNVIGGTFYMNSTFNGANSYVLWITVEGSAYAYYNDSYSLLGVNSGFPIIHAFAHVDMARSGDQMDLVSVVLS